MKPTVDGLAAIIQTTLVHRLLSLARALVLLAPLAIGCHCSHATSGEPEKNPAFNPTSPDGLAAAPPTKAQQMAMSDQEFRDYHIKLANDLCPKAFEHINALNGKPPTDPNPVAKMLLGACYMQGNNAWYKCQMNATTVQELSTCNQRFLRPD